MVSRLHRRKKGWGGWFALLLLAFNLLAGSAQSMPQTAGAAAFICTSHGMISVGDDGKPVAPKNGWGHLCVFCLPMLQGSAATPGPVVVPQPAVYQDNPLFVVSVDPAPSSPDRLTWVHPRAPPVPV